MNDLTICIATIEKRKPQFEALEKRFIQLIGNHPVKIIKLSDNGEYTVGSKRQRLLEYVRTKWICFFDDDDEPYDNYIEDIIYGINQPGVDCIGINGDMTTNGKNQQTWCHRLGFPVAEGAQAKEKGFDYIRPIWHFNPVLTEKALLAGFDDIRFGEDRSYAERLSKHLTREYYIEKPVFHYRYTTKK